MEKKAISTALRADYRKWLMYYLDFRVKYPPPDSRSEQVRLFIEKLRSKNQSQKQLGQAAHALSLFFASQPGKKPAASSVAETMTLLSSSVPSGRELGRGKKPVITHPPLKYPARKPTLTPALVPDGEKTREGTGQKGGKQYNEWRCLKSPVPRNGTRLAINWRTRSRRGIIHGKRSKRMLIGTASSRVI